MFAGCKGSDGVHGVENSKYLNKDGGFSMLRFWSEHARTLPIHALSFRGDVGCNLGASANVEHVFSNSGDLMSDHHASTLGSDVMEAYMIIKENWIYPEFRPTTSEIKEAYEKVHGAKYTHEDDEEDGEDGDEECAIVIDVP